MTLPQNVAVNVRGNFSGNLVVGNHNLVVNNPNGGVVNIVAPPPKPVPRTRPVNLRPRDFPGLLDRAGELDLLDKAMQASLPVTLFGGSGMGKTSLLRKSAQGKSTGNFLDGVVYLPVRGIGRDDLLQSIHDSFFTANADYKPTEGELRSNLGGVRGLILLDDVTLSREDVSAVLDAMPRSVFIISSEERMLWGEGTAIPLDGLPDADALHLFERELGRAFKDEEKPVAVQICRVLLSHPLRILQTASIIREDSLSIPQAFQKLTTTRSQSPTVEMALQKSSDTQKKIFSLLAAAGGFAVTRDHILKLIPAANFDLEVQSMIRRGFVQSSGSSLSLSGDAASAVGRVWNLTQWEDALTDHFTNWLQSAPQDILLDQASDMLFHLLKRVGEKKQWPQLVTLGKALERISILQKKWQRWVQILDLLRMAARALADKKLEGWVLHQLGTRSMCLGAKMEAQEFFKQALNVRTTIGDTSGAQVTQHNLSILLDIPMPVQHVKSGSGGGNFVRWALAAVAGGGAGIVLILLAIFGYQYLTPPPEETPTSTPSFTPDTPEDTDTPIPPTDTVTPTGTRPPTETPTATLTLTPEPVLLFDFVERAGNPDVAYFEYIETNFSTPNAQQSKPVSLNFQQLRTVDYALVYVKSFELPFAGWHADQTLEDSSQDDLVLAIQMAKGNSRVRAIYRLPFDIQRGDEFVARVGHINPAKLIPSDKDGVGYRVYYFEDDVEDAVLLDEIAGFLDGKTHEWRILIPDSLAGRRIRLILEVDSRTNAIYDYTAWLDAVLMGPPR
jgi:hypothetical protein